MQHAKDPPYKSASGPLTSPMLRGAGDVRVPRQVLVIDDDLCVQEILECFLGDGYRVRRSATGAEALRNLRHGAADLVLLDHRLPDCTGLDILPELRSIRPGLPVVMLTGYGSEWICAAAFKLGVADYLQKPVSAIDLVAAVQRILQPGAEKGAPPSEGPMPTAIRASLCMPVEHAMGMIRQRYWENLSLSGLARQVGMSRYRLSHRFHEVAGVTLRDYLLSVRLDRAKALLAAGHASITEVAQGVGFSDLPHFDKVFKRHTGLTPSAYRSSTPPTARSGKHLAKGY